MEPILALILFFCISYMHRVRAAANPLPQLPTIVLVPGAWHSPIHYDLLFSQLRNFGYPIVSGPLPSCDSPHPRTETVAGDAEYVRKTLLLPLINAGKDVVLVMHSYGGCPGSTAAAGLSKAAQTAAGKPGGIIGLIFMCGFIAHEGDSLLSTLPGEKFNPWVVEYVGYHFWISYDPES